MKRLVLALSALLVTPLIGPLPLVAAASAPSVRVAVLGLEGRGVQPSVLSRLSRVCVQSLSQLQGHRPLPGKSLEEVKLVFGCMGEESACMATVGKSLDADKLLWGRVGARGASLVLRLVLLDVASGQLIRGRRAVLAPEDIDNPHLAVSSAVRELLGLRPATIRLSSSVVGADVTLDGQLMGRTDGGVFVLPDVSVGTHLLAAYKPDELAWSRTVTVDVGAGLSFRAEAVAAPAPLVRRAQRGESTDEVAPSTRGWQVAFWTSLGLTAALGGAVLATGLTVRAAEDEKDAALADLDGQGGRGFDDGQLDAMRRGGCEALVKTGDLARACDKGADYRRVTNILIGPLAGLGALTAVLGGIWLYKALAADSSTSDEDVESADDLAGGALRIVPTAGPNGQGVGVLVAF